MSDEIDEDEEEGFLGSIGFMFDAQHVRLMKTVCFGDNISLKIKLIGEDPGETLRMYFHKHYGDSSQLFNQITEVHNTYRSCTVRTVSMAGSCVYWSISG